MWRVWYLENGRPLKSADEALKSKDLQGRMTMPQWQKL